MSLLNFIAIATACASLLYCSSAPNSNTQRKIEDYKYSGIRSRLLIHKNPAIGDSATCAWSDGSRRTRRVEKELGFGRWEVSESLSGFPDLSFRMEVDRNGKVYSAQALNLKTGIRTELPILREGPLSIQVHESFELSRQIVFHVPAGRFETGTAVKTIFRPGFIYRNVEVAAVVESVPFQAIVEVFHGQRMDDSDPDLLYRLRGGEDYESRCELISFNKN